MEVRGRGEREERGNNSDLIGRQGLGTTPNRERDREGLLDRVQGKVPTGSGKSASSFITGRFSCSRTSERDDE